jgi:hypothetical protein
MGSSRITPLSRRNRGRGGRGGRGSKGPLAVVPRPSWKLLGLAGVAGVAATGVVVARNRRAHREVEPDELRDRLRERLAAVGATPPQPPADGS